MYTKFENFLQLYGSYNLGSNVANYLHTPVFAWSNDVAEFMQIKPLLVFEMHLKKGYKKKERKKIEVSLKFKVLNKN